MTTTQELDLRLQAAVHNTKLRSNAPGAEYAYLWGMALHILTPAQLEQMVEYAEKWAASHSKAA